MTLFYSQSAGTLARADATIAGIGYAGRGEGLNNPTMQNVAKTGPLPRGDYTIGQPHDSPRTGAYTLDLVPDAGNEMFGRDAFRIHGDNGLGDQSASEGCIVVARAVREGVWAAGDHRVRVIA